jgi:hypothetical protein
MQLRFLILFGDLRDDAADAAIPSLQCSKQASARFTSYEPCGFGSQQRTTKQKAQHATELFAW